MKYPAVFGSMVKLKENYKSTVSVVKTLQAIHRDKRKIRLRLEHLLNDQKKKKKEIEAEINFLLKLKDCLRKCLMLFYDLLVKGTRVKENK